MVRRKINSRYIILVAVVILLGCVWSYRLANMQIINGESYLQTSVNRMSSNMVVSAPRGDIVDRYGRPLINNRVGYSVQLQKTDISNDNFNAMLLKLAKMFIAENIQYTDTFPVSRTEPYAFVFYDKNQNESIEDEKSEWLKLKKLPSNATPDEAVFDYSKKYKISQSYNREEIRIIVGMRYEIDLRGFSVVTPFVVAEDVSVNLVAKIKEQKTDLPGVSITTNYIRNYVQGDLASHILGRVGIMYKEEYDLMKAKGYIMSDVVGKQGIEKICEAQLRGQNGTQSVARTINGQVVEVMDAKPPVAGKTVVLTLDSRLQRVAEDSLKTHINNIRASGGPKNGIDANAGAVVILDVNSGDVLAMATYPTYNPIQFNTIYGQMLKDPNKPMLNRAIAGTYTPGSTFKPITAIAGLETGTITPDTIIVDKGVFTKYKGQQPACWIWNEYHTTHGSVNVSKAIEVSCNYFFYETGDQMGIDTIDKYAQMFGLGDKTGIEFASEEAKGILASPTNKAKIEKTEKNWYPGDTLRAAIGQSYNTFTPLQLANYIATVVNGGKRYQPHIIKNVRSSIDAELTNEYSPKILADIKLKAQTIKAVEEGMKNVAEEGTASSVFGSDYAIKIGGKTGSAQVGSGSAHGLFIGFAPYDNPQIAICIALEHGAAGSNAAYVARDVIDAYFLTQDSTENPVIKNQLLK